VVKPGADLNILLKSEKSDIVKLTNKDVILLCGASNDLNKKNSKQLSNTLPSLSNLKTILIFY
jgi:hypothetical protein